MELLQSYWSIDEIKTNGIILLHLMGALAVGLSLGYERTYHGRAAGMRTYALVCVSTTALTVLNAYPSMWYGGHSMVALAADPTRVIQGIMTGIGFLGAGVIMKEGFTIRGLSTAASIWMTAAIGVLIGVGFYAAAMFATLLSILIMSGFRWLEDLLPHQRIAHLSISYHRGNVPAEESIRNLAKLYDFHIVDWAYQMNPDGEFEYQLVLQAEKNYQINELAKALADSAEVMSFRVSPTRA
ncbi:MAG: MgtC/SapB family protein [Burkholderiales bacterium]|nr:MgtC/SapB family protein [Burkholderiales bacterium]